MGNLREISVIAWLLNILRDITNRGKTFKLNQLWCETFPSHTSDHWGLNTEMGGKNNIGDGKRRWRLRRLQSRDVSPILSPPLFFIQAFVLSLIRRTAGYILSRRKKALLPDDKEWERNRCCLHHYHDSTTLRLHRDSNNNEWCRNIRWMMEIIPHQKFFFYNT